MSEEFRCYAKNCPNKSGIRNLRFFIFPSDIAIRKIWVKNCGIESLVGPKYRIRFYMRVCEKHFEDKMFVNAKRRNFLETHAVPTLFNIQGSLQLLNAENWSIENGDLSNNNDTRTITYSSNSQDTEDRQKPANKTTQRKFEAHACCITRCSNSADNLNKDKNAKYKPFAVFTPSSIENRDQWSSVSGKRMTMKSKVCEKHFKSEDIRSRDVFITDTSFRNEKSLKRNAVPSKIKKYEITLKRHKVNNGNNNVLIENTRKNDDKITVKTVTQINSELMLRDIRVNNSSSFEHSPYMIQNSRSNFEQPIINTSVDQTLPMNLSIAKYDQVSSIQSFEMIDSTEDKITYGKGISEHYEFKDGDPDP